MVARLKVLVGYSCGESVNTIGIDVSRASPVISEFLELRLLPGIQWEASTDNVGLRRKGAFPRFAEVVQLVQR